MAEKTRMRSQRRKATSAVAVAYRRLVSAGNCEQGVSAEDLQAEAEYLLDAIKFARRVGCQQLLLIQNDTED